MPEREGLSGRDRRGFELVDGSRGQGRTNDLITRRPCKEFARLPLHTVAVLICVIAVSTPTRAAITPCSPLPSATAQDFRSRLQRFLDNVCYEKQNWPHDGNVRSSDGVHFFVKVWYSPALMSWINNNRVGSPANGAMLVKEEHRAIDGPLSFWSVMVKDSNLSWDGWYWAGLSPSPGKTPQASDPATASDSAIAGCKEPEAPGSGAGLVCLACHASAISNSGTFATTAYLAPQDQAHVLPISGLIHGRDALAPPGQVADPADDFTGRVPSSVFANAQPIAKGAYPCMVSEALDHVFPASASHGGPQEFITSDQCAGCHDASGLLAGLTPNMIYDPAGPSPQNLSPYGEWRYSMMGLAGRDPIFFAQLDTESTVHRRLKNKRNGPAFVQDLCLRCHGVMGQRQFHIDRGNGPRTLFTRAQLQRSNSKYGALARDGVSCVSCHHMSDDELADPSTYTGLFKVGPPTEVYGQFLTDTDPTGAKTGDAVIPLPMENALGITPKEGPQMKRADLCASCHTIALPVYDAKGNQVLENGQPKTDFEQTTYFEWLNSGFSAIVCQECHMRRTFNDDSLPFKMANIEDNTFPAMPRVGPSTRLPDADLILQTRNDPLRPFRRHELLGLNVFALDMFDQFRTDLGLYKVDPNLPFSFTTLISSQKTAVANAVNQARTLTASVAISAISVDNGTLQADVEVDSTTGHNFPSGVSFRRAFLDFQVLDVGGKVLWESGNTNADGVIVDNSGTPLVTEFFDENQQTYQPHFWTGNPITSDNQVQIYEELVVNPEGLLTTSFLSRDHKVKDNRIQPRGRSSDGPNAAITAPVGTSADPSYSNECGCSIVRYQLPLTGVLTTAGSVKAMLYYQSIPPYYLRQRSEDGRGSDTRRLTHFVNSLDLSRYPEISNWKLLISGSDTVAIP